jgi:hypothetical protein
MKYNDNPWQQFLWKLLQLSKSESNLKKPRRSKNRKKSTIKKKRLVTLRQEGNKDADRSVDSLRWREFQKKSMHSCIKQGLGGS